MSVPKDLVHIFSVLADRESRRVAPSRGSQLLQRDTAALREAYSVKQSALHRQDNRYSNVLSYDRTSVIDEGIEYLNANVVCTDNGHWWVAAQAPLPHTTHAFLHAMYRQSASKHPKIVARRSGPQQEQATRSVIVVRLTDWHERGIVKADQWLSTTATGKMRHVVPADSSRRTLPAMVVENRASTRHDDLSSTMTECLIYPEGASDTMRMFHYYFDAWPDHGVPQGNAVTALKALVLDVGKKRESLGGQDHGEVWVHCSAGVGRTGAFIALSSLLLPRLAPESSQRTPSPLGPLPAELQSDDVARTVDEIREWRGMLVQNIDQLRLVYQLAGYKTGR